MQTKCDVCKKSCVCHFCPDNGKCRYSAKQKCKTVTYCGRYNRLEGGTKTCK